MDGKRFDDLSRKLATPHSRRGVLGLLGAAVAGLVGGSAGSAAPRPDKPSKCYGAGSSCTNAKQCCSGICTNRRCAPEPAPECTVATTCPGTDTECQQRTCLDGRCGMVYAPLGTVLATQTAGDCKRAECDGAGGVTNAIDDSDLPVDGNECTQDICTNGVPSNPPVAAGEPCGENGSQVCNGNGGCGGCTPGQTVSCYSGPTGPNGEIFGICRAGSRTCLPDGSGYGECVGEVGPQEETCNGLDDDCDGVVDESDPRVGSSCQTGRQGVCATGTLQCENGALVCRPDREPQPEVCNGLDDDCDGEVDEGNPGGGVPCTVSGLFGVCAEGITECVNGAIVCRQTNFPQPEVCNGRDDNCNGTIDDGNPGGGQVCHTGLPGICGQGVTACVNGRIICQQVNFPRPETCNGLDDNCNGIVDDGNPGGGLACNTGQPGECAAGVTECRNGALICVPANELC